MSWIRILTASLLASVMMSTPSSAADSAYIRKVEHWRHEWDQFMRSKKSPLIIIGKADVREGESPLGSDPASSILFPQDAATHLGTLVRHLDDFSFNVAPDVEVRIDGKKPHFDPGRPRSIGLRVAPRPKPSDEVSFGRFGFVIRPESSTYHLYVLDQENPKTFKGIDWFPINPTYRVTAHFIAEDKKRTATLAAPDGRTMTFPVAGDVVFEIDGQTQRLQALALKEGKTFFVTFW